MGSPVAKRRMMSYCKFTVADRELSDDSLSSAPYCWHETDGTHGIGMQPIGG